MSFKVLRAGAMALALMAVPTTAQAETLREALASAYANNPEIMSALLSVKSSAENIALAKSGKLPNIGLSGDLSAGFQANGNYTTSQSFTVGLGYQQRLFDNFKTDAEIEQARALTELSAQALRNAEQNVLLSVVQAYMNVIRDQQLVKLRADNVEFFQTQVQSADDRLRIGEGTKIDVSQAQARLAQGQAAYQAALSSLQTSQASYMRWVGHKPQNLSQDFKFSGLMPKSIDEAISLAEARHPAVMSAKAAIRAAQSGTDAARAAFGPTLDLIGNICTINCFGGAQNTGISGSVKLSLSIPLYTGGALGASMRKANIEQIKSEVDAVSTRDQIREAVISSWSALQNASAQIDSANAALEAGQLALDGVIQERDVGQRTTLDVLNARSELTATREGLISASSSRIIASFALIASTGRLSAEELKLGVTLKSGEGYAAAVEDVWQELRAINE